MAHGVKKVDNTALQCCIVVVCFSFVAGTIRGSMQKPDLGLYSTADIAMGHVHAERFCTICEVSVCRIYL